MRGHRPKTIKTTPPDQTPVAVEKKRVWLSPEERQEEACDEPIQLPVEVVEVEAIPRYVDHKMADTIQRRADSLIGWNYYTLDSSRRRSSRRYEGFR
jgi:hypothetical protein